MRNICKFKISIEKKNNTINYSSQIKIAYKKTLTVCEDYESYITAKFDSQGETFKAAFNKKELIAVKNAKGILYFIFIKDADQNLDQCSLEIVFISKDKNLSRCITQVYSNIKKILKFEKIKIEYQLSEVYLYLTDKITEDVMYPQITINASLEKYHRFEKKELWSYFSYFVISFILIILGITKKENETILWSCISCTIGFFIPNIVSFIAKVIPANKVIIQDFAQWIDQTTKEQNSLEETEKFKNPTIPEQK